MSNTPKDDAERFVRPEKPERPEEGYLDETVTMELTDVAQEISRQEQNAPEKGETEISKEKEAAAEDAGAEDKSGTADGDEKGEKGLADGDEKGEKGLADGGEKGDKRLGDGDAEKHLTSWCSRRRRQREKRREEDFSVAIWC